MLYEEKVEQQEIEEFSLSKHIDFWLRKDEQEYNTTGLKEVKNKTLVLCRDTSYISTPKAQQSLLSR